MFLLNWARCYFMFLANLCLMSHVNTLIWEEYVFVYLQSFHGSAAGHFPLEAAGAWATQPSITGDTVRKRPSPLSITPPPPRQNSHPQNCARKWVTEIIWSELTLSDEVGEAVVS